MSDRTVFRVREGVEWVNGARVPPDRKVRLTEAEARFDLDQGRIEPDVAAAETVADAFPDVEGEADELDAAVGRTERSITQGARRGKRRFKLAGEADGRD